MWIFFIKQYTSEYSRRITNKRKKKTRQDIPARERRKMENCVTFRKLSGELNCVLIATIIKH